MFKEITNGYRGHEKPLTLDQLKELVNNSADYSVYQLIPHIQVGDKTQYRVQIHASNLGQALYFVKVGKWEGIKVMIETKSNDTIEVVSDDFHMSNYKVYKNI